MKQMSWLPEPKYNPKMPSKASLASKALRLLLEGRHVSHPDFESFTGSWRLAAHVYILKKLGWPIKTKFRSIDGEEFEQERSRTMGIYFLPEDCLELVNNFN